MSLQQLIINGQRMLKAFKRNDGQIGAFRLDWRCRGRRWGQWHKSLALLFQAHGGFHFGGAMFALMCHFRESGAYMGIG